VVDVVPKCTSRLFQRWNEVGISAQNSKKQTAFISAISAKMEVISSRVGLLTLECRDVSFTGRRSRTWTARDTGFSSLTKGPERVSATRCRHRGRARQMAQAVLRNSKAAQGNLKYRGYGLDKHHVTAYCEMMFSHSGCVKTMMIQKLK
jgi:hypothetical protein